DIIFNREPSPLTQSVNRAPDVTMTHTVNDLIFDIEYQATSRFKGFVKRLVECHEPIYKFVRMDAVIMITPRVCVRRRGHNQVNLPLKGFEFFTTVTCDNRAGGQ